MTGGLCVPTDPDDAQNPRNSNNEPATVIHRSTTTFPILIDLRPAVPRSTAVLITASRPSLALAPAPPQAFISRIQLVYRRCCLPLHRYRLKIRDEGTSGDAGLPWAHTLANLIVSVFECIDLAVDYRRQYLLSNFDRLIPSVVHTIYAHRSVEEAASSRRLITSPRNTASPLDSTGLRRGIRE